MKCDKLEARTIYVDCLGRTIVYFDPYEVNDAIKELKQKLQDQCISCPVKMQEDDVVAELKQKLEDAKATAYAESVDAGMENRMLKRALWLARAKRATEKADSFIDIKVTYNGVCNIDHSIYPQNNARRMLTCDEWLDVWTNVWEKCLKKAEEYK